MSNIIEIRKKACLSNWFPPVEKSGVPVPKTHIIKTDVRLLELLEGEMPPPRGYPEFRDTLAYAARSLGLPVFLRTGQTSNKHDWLDTCYLQNIKKLDSHIYKLLEFSECVDILGLDYDVWAVREMLPTTPIFHHWNWLPITKERRYFVSDGEVVCHHPYWIRDAFGFLRYAEEMALAELNTETKTEIAELKKLAKRAGGVLPGNWSLDFLETKKGWFLIDAAPAEYSWHHPRCEKAKLFEV